MAFQSISPKIFLRQLLRGKIMNGVTGKQFCVQFMNSTFNTKYSPAMFLFPQRRQF